MYGLVRILPCLAAIAASEAAAVTAPRSSQLTVKTSSGTVHGIIHAAQPNVRQFLGIPFAEPPTGSLRWEPPEPLPQSASSRVLQATELPASCPQYLTTKDTSLYENDVLQFNLQGLNRTGATTEDCLTLSVWTPTEKSVKTTDAANSELMPVLVFIYGGGFTTGGQAVPYQLPPQWVQRSPNHLVVSFNYRLNIFGFPNAPDLSSQNLGILDQRMAVKWLQENVERFGGDPKRMVLWGQSAGAASVDIYNYAFPSDPIVSGLIMDSGTALLGLASVSGNGDFSVVASKVGCPNLADMPAQQLACMRKVPFQKIETFLQQYQDGGLSPSISFLPVADEKIVFSNFTKRAQQGKLAHIPAIIGTNAQEGVTFAPYPITDPAVSPNQTIAQEIMLSTFFCPATETVRLRDEASSLIFRYKYSGNWSNIAVQPWEGAYHASELPMIMGTFDNFRGQGPKLENETSVAMQDAWAAFARDGANGLESLHWKPYSVGADTAREFGDGVAAKDTNLRKLEAMCNGASPAP